MTSKMKPAPNGSGPVSRIKSAGEHDDSFRDIPSAKKSQVIAYVLNGNLVVIETTFGEAARHG